MSVTILSPLSLQYLKVVSCQSFVIPVAHVFLIVDTNFKAPICTFQWFLCHPFIWTSFTTSILYMRII